jgi:hypothetical protein
MLPTNKEWFVDEFMDVFLKLVESDLEIKNMFRIQKDKFYRMNREFAQKIIQLI